VGWWGGAPPSLTLPHSASPTTITPPPYSNTNNVLKMTFSRLNEHIFIDSRVTSLLKGTVHHKSRGTDLCLNMRAGSMLAEVSRTTCRISLAIILSFSKFTRPSMLESFPEGGGGGDRCTVRGRPAPGCSGGGRGGEADLRAGR